MGIDEPLLATPGGFLFTRERVARLAEDETFPWIAGLRNNGPIVFSEEEREEFFSSLICSPALPMLDLPEELQYEEVTLSPRKCLKISQPAFQLQERSHAGGVVRSSMRAIPCRNTPWREASTRLRRDAFIRRDVDAEKSRIGRSCPSLACATSKETGARDAGWKLAPNKLPRVVRALVESGWHVVADGKVFRQPGQSQRFRFKRRGLVRASRRD